MSVIASAAHVCVLGRLPEECTPASPRLTVSRHSSFRTLTRILVAFTTAYRRRYPFLRLFCVCCRCRFDSHFFFGVSCHGLCPPLTPFPSSLRPTPFGCVGAHSGAPPLPFSLALVLRRRSFRLALFMPSLVDLVFLFECVCRQAAKTRAHTHALEKKGAGERRPIPLLRALDRIRTTHQYGRGHASECRRELYLHGAGESCNEKKTIRKKRL